MLTALCLMLTATPTDASALGESAQQQLEAYLATHTQVGLVMGLHRQGEVQVFAWGRISDEEPPVAPDRRTIYEIGSITKTFTGLALAQAVVQGEIGLETTLAAALPEVGLSEAVRAVTLKQLATHSSGLPRLPWSMTPDAVVSSNPYAQFTRERLDGYLLTAKVSEERINVYAYSNLGAGLLGDLLARRAELNYGELIRMTICEPLGMTDTVTVLSPEQRARFIRPLSASGKVSSSWEFDALSGAGALRSSLDDMLRYVAVQLNPGECPGFREAIELSQQSHFQASERLHLGLGWHLNRQQDDSFVHWHNGGTGGYSTFLSFHRPTQTGVVVLCNSGDALKADYSITRLGQTIQEHLRSTGR